MTWIHVGPQNDPTIISVAFYSLWGEFYSFYIAATHRPLAEEWCSHIFFLSWTTMQSANSCDLSFFSFWRNSKKGNDGYLQFHFTEFQLIRGFWIWNQDLIHMKQESFFLAPSRLILLCIDINIIQVIHIKTEHSLEVLKFLCIFSFGY